MTTRFERVETCEHGEDDRHRDERVGKMYKESGPLGDWTYPQCPGGSRIVLEHETFWLCERHDRLYQSEESPQFCAEGYSKVENSCQMVKRTMVRE